MRVREGEGGGGSSVEAEGIRERARGGKRGYIGKGCIPAFVNTLASLLFFFPSLLCVLRLLGGLYRRGAQLYRDSSGRVEMIKSFYGGGWSCDARERM